jgi:hypothetical protein
MKAVLLAMRASVVRAGQTCKAQLSTVSTIMGGSGRQASRAISAAMIITAKMQVEKTGMILLDILK